MPNPGWLKIMPHFLSTSKTCNLERIKKRIFYNPMMHIGWLLVFWYMLLPFFSRQIDSKKAKSVCNFFLIQIYPTCFSNTAFKNCHCEFLYVLELAPSSLLMVACFAGSNVSTCKQHPVGFLLDYVLGSTAANRMIQKARQNIKDFGIYCWFIC
jgi:hypothetical protein